jgi:hypothetical protein
VERGGGCVAVMRLLGVQESPSPPSVYEEGREMAHLAPTHAAPQQSAKARWAGSAVLKHQQVEVSVELAPMHLSNASGGGTYAQAHTTPATTACKVVLPQPQESVYSPLSTHVCADADE